jgi:hypothetical protein
MEEDSNFDAKVRILKEQPGVNIIVGDVLLVETHGVKQLEVTKLHKEDLIELLAEQHAEEVKTKLKRLLD